MTPEEINHAFWTLDLGEEIQILKPNSPNVIAIRKYEEATAYRAWVVKHPDRYMPYSRDMLFSWLEDSTFAR